MKQFLNKIILSIVNSFFKSLLVPGFLLVHAKFVAYKPNP